MKTERRELVLGKTLRWLGVVGLFGLVLYLLRGVLTPIFLALLIAYILDPIVDRLEKWRIPRAAGIAIVLGSFFGAIAIFALLVVPGIVRDLISVAKELPSHLTQWMAQVEPHLVRVGIRLPHTAEEWIAQLPLHADKLDKLPLARIGDFLTQIVGGTFSALGAVVAAIIVPILAVYFLNDFDRFTRGVRELLPLRYRVEIEETAAEVDAVISQFLRGQLTVMAILAVLYGGTYAALGVRLAIPIGIAAGILNVVPYVGSAFALVAGLFMALIAGGGWGQIIGVIVAYVVVQTLEGFVITPRIVGESVGLREVWVLLALFVGGEVFGVLGVLLAVPAAAVLKIFIERAVKRYQASTLYLGDAALVPELAPSPEPSEAPTAPRPTPKPAPPPATPAKGAPSKGRSSKKRR
jgi:predicted PurR-regulated permease PerM